MRPVVAVITARAGSRRLPGKNWLPIGGRPLAVRAAEAAEAIGLSVIVTSDMPILRATCAGRGWYHVDRPAELARGESYEEHEAAIRHALDRSGIDAANHSVLLLQPTSPFRSPARLLAALAAHQESGRAVLSTYGGHLRPRALWDGNFALYRATDPNWRNDFIPHASPWLESLQIDTPDDYAQALHLHRAGA